MFSIWLTRSHSCRYHVWAFFFFLLLLFYFFINKVSKLGGDKNMSYKVLELFPNLRNINLHNITHSLISRNRREWVFIFQISLFVITFLSLISQIVSWLLQTTKEVNPHPRIVLCVNMWSVTFFFFFCLLCHLLNVGACICYIAWEGQVEWTSPTEVRREWIQIS